MSESTKGPIKIETVIFWSIILLCIGVAAFFGIMAYASHNDLREEFALFGDAMGAWNAIFSPRLIVPGRLTTTKTRRIHVKQETTND